MEDKKIERVIQNELRKISNKVDFSELDEIQEQLQAVSKSVKPFRLFSLFLIAVFAFAGGWGFSVYKPFLPILQEKQKVLNSFENRGLNFGETEKYKYISFPRTIKIIKTKNNDYAITIKK